ncbi:hypothetical protein Tco_1515389 [Tanacetum coccineum]
MIDIFNKKITLRVGDDEAIFDVDQSIKRPTTEDDECYGMDDLDDTVNVEAQKLLANEESDSFLSRGLEKSIDQSDQEGCEPVKYKPDKDSDSDELIRRIASINTPYPFVQETAKPMKVEREHLYLASANEIDEKKPELKDLPHHLEYAYLHGDKSFPIIISSELSEKEKMSLLQVLEKRNRAIAWKMSDIKGISPSYCTHKILIEDGFKPVIQPQRHLNLKVQDVCMQELLLQFSKDLPTLGNTSNQLKQKEQDSSQYWKPPVYYSDDDDDSYRVSIDETPPSDVITSDLPITDSLVMEDEHLDSIPETDSNEEIESSVKNLNLAPSESEDLSDYVSECDFPFCDNSLNFNNDSEIFSNPLFDSNDNYTSSDDESSSEEDVSVENFKIYSNPLLEFDEEIFSSEINPLYNEVLEDLDSIPPGNENDHFNAESDLIESLLNKDTVITSPKIDFLLQEFAGELALINSIPSGIDEVDFDHKEDIRLTEKLLYDISSPRPSEELNSEISIESFSPSPIPVEDSDSLMEEIDTNRID